MTTGTDRVFDARRALLLAGAALALPAWAQVKRKVTVAMLLIGKSGEDDAGSARFVAEMRRRGWIDGQNISYQRFFTEGSRERADEVARAAVKANPDLIYSATGGGVTAAKKATATIPIVFITTSDPVAGGQVQSLRQPGQNATGVFQMGAEVISKRLELIHEALPRARRVGVLLDSRAGDYGFQKTKHEESPKPRGMSLELAELSRFEQVPAALDQLKSKGVGVFIISPSFTLTSQKAKLLALAAERRMAAVAFRSEWAELGAFITYGASEVEVHQRSAGIADRILRGAKAADTPVERASKFELIVNVRTAKALGITLPKSFLMRADRVIE
jgi:putative tryptophan/tyrosine transport system substrate-binding protein